MDRRHSDHSPPSVLQSASVIAFDEAHEVSHSALQPWSSSSVREYWHDIFKELDDEPSSDDVPLRRIGVQDIAVEGLNLDIQKCVGHILSEFHLPVSGGHCSTGH